MIGYIRTRYRGRTPGILAKRMRQLNKEVFQEDGELWHAEMREKRFTYAGARELGYARRSGEGLRGRKGYSRTYTGRKERMFGHRLPLVYSGESRQLARIRDIRPSQHGVRIVIHARRLNIRNPHSSINMREEFTRFSDREEKRLSLYHDKRLQRRIDAIQETETKQVI